MLDELLSLLGYLSHSGDAILGEILSLRYCKCRFGARVLSWRLPLHGAVRGLVTKGSEDVGMVSISVAASQGLRLLALCLEELEAVGWKEREVLGRE